MYFSLQGASVLLNYEEHMTLGGFSNTCSQESKYSDNHSHGNRAQDHGSDIESFVIGIGNTDTRSIVASLE